MQTTKQQKSDQGLRNNNESIQVIKIKLYDKEPAS